MELFCIQKNNVVFIEYFLNRKWVHYDPNTKETFRLHVINAQSRFMILTMAKVGSWILITLRDVLPVAQLFAKGE